MGIEFENKVMKFKRRSDGNMKNLILIMLVLAGLSCKTANQPNLSASYGSAPDLTNISYEGGEGNSMETAIIISNAQNTRRGIAAEYAYLEKRYGEKNIAWQLKSQSLDRSTDKIYNIITIHTIPEYKEITVYFDITEFYGKL